MKISRENAEKSADEWLGTGDSYMRTCFIEMLMDPTQHRDIGKLLAPCVEIYVNKWLCEKTKRSIRKVVNDAYDGQTDDDKLCIRHQTKFRMNTWHLETTRRNSRKNIDTNSTGHVAYRKTEFDVLVIFIPSPIFGIHGSKIRIIPCDALINPKKPDQLVTRINNSIRKLYDCDEKTEEMIRNIYQKFLLPLD